MTSQPATTTASAPARPSFAILRRRVVDGWLRLLRTYPYVVTCVGLTLAFLGLAWAVSAHIGVPIE